MTPDKMTFNGKYKFGLYDSAFKMISRELLEDKLEVVDGAPAEFQIAFGPVKWYENTLNEGYVLEIKYKDVDKAIQRKVPSEGFFSQLIYDYIKAADNVVKRFCQEKDLVVVNHINSWPVYQAIVLKKV